MILTRVAISTLLVCLLNMAGMSQSNSGNKDKPEAATIFSIDKEPVTADEFIYLYQKNHQNKQEEFTEQKVQEYLDLFINFKLKVKEAQRRGIDTTTAFKREYNSYKEELRKPYLPDSKLTDSLVKLTYNRMKEEVRASHILINVAAEAAPSDTLKAYNKIIEIRSRALKGEDFGALAQQNSEDPSARINKGDLGYFTAMQMVYAFEVAAYGTKVGEISMPVRTRFGYHIVKVNDRRPARGEVEVSHIMFKTGDDSDNEKSKNRAFEIYDELQKGVKWEELCKQYSEDPGSKDNGGKLRPFGVGAMAGVPEFERAAFELDKPGEISDPVKTQYGWHIIRLERKIPLPPFEEMASSLKTRVNRDERTQISKHALQTKLKKEFGFVENSATKTKLMVLADTTLRLGKWKPQLLANDETLFTLQNRRFTGNMFLEYARANQRANASAPEKYLEQLYNNYVDAMLGQQMEEKIIQQSPDYKWLLKEYYEGILLFDIMEKEVWNKASDDSVGQRKYFEANVARYEAKERVRARLFSSQSAEDIERLRPLLQQSDSIKMMEFAMVNNIRHETGTFEKQEKAVLAKVPWAPGVHSTENNGLYYLVWVRDILPPGRKTFDEARPAVISDYQNHLEKTWVEQLKKKYNVKVNKKGKQLAFENLIKKST
ncbi:MAG: peptidylprolyl isomerase [Bacteroidota bacterium]